MSGDHGDKNSMPDNALLKKSYKQAVVVFPVGRLLHLVGTSNPVHSPPAQQ
jgi:hypothetical protein